MVIVLVTVNVILYSCKSQWGWKCRAVLFQGKLCCSAVYYLYCKYRQELSCCWDGYIISKKSFEYLQLSCVVGQWSKLISELRRKVCIAYDATLLSPHRSKQWLNSRCSTSWTGQFMTFITKWVWIVVVGVDDSSLQMHSRHVYSKPLFLIRLLFIAFHSQ